MTVLGAGVVTGTGAGILRALNSEDGSGEGRLLLQTDATSGVGILEKPLKELGLARVGANHWQTPVLNTALVTMAGFTWRDGVRPPKILVRFRSKGGWSLWRPAPLLRDLPDPASGEGIGKAGTSPLFVEESDGVQVQVSGSLPPELSITLIHAAQLAGDARLVAGTTSRSGLRAAPVNVPVPLVYTRAQWGANESWRDGPPRYNNTILQAHIHHSASGNGYSQAEVPALIRSFYKYHTHSLGWSDIAYNFLVDSFGSIWEGRYGGIDKPVRGAHTLGFNASSTGICVIGNLDTVQPTQATLDALPQIVAYKLAAYGRDPMGWTDVKSEGSDKFPAGKVVTLPVIDGHRDTNDTACPGRNLYAQLGTIRAATARVISAATLKLKTPFRVKGRPILGHTLTALDGKFKPRSATVSYQWLRNGVAIDGAVLASYVTTAEDVAQVLGVVVSGSVPGVEPVSQTITLTKQVRSIPVCQVRTQRKHGGKVIVHFEVTAPGIAAPDGTVVIKVGSRQRTVTVKKGKAIARFLKVDPGRYRVRCQYAGGTLVEPGKARDWVRVPGKGPFARS
ncbi:MAG TPA: N-acetylmuramoyl-L-alanine amidase [Nocardioides sp.]|uniref:N-acetylmuramoyl-L-alanine amidase n=1 Tax=Nocardioides sp. TaxID=35761 RepID=UPI002E332D49|nr:N-acetylmuramoyl-L-alanine amidase [Nocardioides sp.]HEX5088081.1 N-acetylmuramoyl-L-alanine amidase [Nocardioides sp.]